MSYLADIIVNATDGRIILIVEVKSRLDISPSWAAQLMRNYQVHGMLPQSSYFLLALPDRFYIWKDAGTNRESVEPTYEVDAIPFLGPYYEKARIAPDHISHQSLELIVSSWLHELVQFGLSENIPIEKRRILEETGLPDYLKGGHISMEVPA